jgi:hypothetical protein
MINDLKRMWKYVIMTLKSSYVLSQHFPVRIANVLAEI